ncbi:glycosyl hydrolase [Paenibacillus sp. JMULE4]|uniref:Glycosyl hydrolase n=1 Tax=Paenibacillus validus TaxID=44253 RepID=A0A7X2ZFJ1_9BACL|nr:MULTISPECIES: glycosyl hydrolase [Paenibacillus]MUG73993.1 glycosyl hydrolase [Paenibacillus validus]NTZ19445.1 glycosyl hydrolase [Paenibacillus sp. JMULE4]
MKKVMSKIYPLMFAAMTVFPAQIFAHGTEEEHQRESLLGNYVFFGIVILFLILLLSFILISKKVKQLNNAKNEADRAKRKQLAKAAKVFKWTAIGAFVAVLISGFAVLSGGSKTTAETEAQQLKEVTMEHAHGMSYSPDGNKLFFAVHDGLRVYEKDQWLLPAGEKHDYMGFSMVDDGFYSSGHPAPGSNKKNPFGIVKSTDEGKSFEALALYGDIDFHGMSVGYKSHTIYVFNPEPNAKMKTTGLHYSTDEAKSWTKTAMKGMEGQPVALAVHPTNEAVVAVGTEKGVFVSRDYGQHFEQIGPTGQITALFFNAQGSLFVGGIDNKSATLIRMDIDAKQTGNINIPAITEDAIAFIAQNPVNEQELAVMTFNKDGYTSSDGGKRWTKIVDQGKGTSTQK